MEKAKEVCRAVKSYFAQHDMKLNAVAATLGVSPQTVTEHLSGERLFGRRNATRYAEVFGFNPTYLMTGDGSLVSNHEHVTVEPEQAATLEIPAQVAETLSRMSATILSQQQTISLLVRGGDITNQPPHHCEG